jgi:AcrR family transcriptional regulator
MGRRSSHTPEQLRHLILDASRDIIEAEGLVGYSAREVARKIDYSAGTLYNVFRDLDDVLVTLQKQLLDDAALSLAEVQHGNDPRQRLFDLARAYVSFALTNRRLWNLLFQHQPPANGSSDQLHDGVNKIIAAVADAIAPLMPNAKDGAADHAARVLWAGVHGITAIAVTEKSPTMTPETALSYVEALTTTYIKGLTAG